MCVKVHISDRGRSMLSWMNIFDLNSLEEHPTILALRYEVYAAHSCHLDPIHPFHGGTTPSLPAVLPPPTSPTYPSSSSYIIITELTAINGTVPRQRSIPRTPHSPPAHSLPLNPLVALFHLIFLYFILFSFICYHPLSVFLVPSFS